MDNGAAHPPSNAALAADIRDLRTTLYGDPVRRIVGIAEKIDGLIDSEKSRVTREAVTNAQIKLIMYGVGLLGVTNVMGMLNTLIRGLFP